MYSSLIVPIVFQLTSTWTPSYLIKNFILSSYVASWQFKEDLKETEKENIWMAVEKMRKGKRKFEIKRKRCKLCREEMDVTEEVEIVGLLL